MSVTVSVKDAFEVTRQIDVHEIVHNLNLSLFRHSVIDVLKATRERITVKSRFSGVDYEMLRRDFDQAVINASLKQIERVN